MTELPEKWIIRTSDRGTFRRCRNLWDMTSKMRQDFEYVPGIEPLDFGIAYHNAMEEYYNVELWESDPDGEIRKVAAEAAFLSYMAEWKKRQLATGHWGEEQSTRHKELLDMGLGMMRHYWTWAVKEDKHYAPVKTEIEFEVPIPVTRDFKLPYQFQYDDGYLHFMGRPVVYQGRIDVIVQDMRTGRLWIMDHKTAAQFRESLQHLDLDPQCGSYAWAAAKMLGLDIEGVIYSEHRKKVPKDPQILKSGELSRNKAQDTTAAHYRKYVIENNYALKEYEDFIEVLALNEQAFFRRTTVNRNGEELISVELNILHEAIDMLNDPYIYPNPSMWNCSGCAFTTPCVASQDGSGADWALNHSGLYIKRNKLTLEGASEAAV